MGLGGWLLAKLDEDLNSRAAAVVRSVMDDAFVAGGEVMKKYVWQSGFEDASVNQNLDRLE